MANDADERQPIRYDNQRQLLVTAGINKRLRQLWRNHPHRISETNDFRVAQPAHIVGNGCIPTKLRTVGEQQLARFQPRGWVDEIG